MAEEMKRRGEQVLILGDVSLEEGLSSADIVVLGLPMSQDGETVATDIPGQKIYVEALASKMCVRHTLMAGKISGEHRLAFERRGISCIDYLRREELAVSNAIPTAEGAVQIIMQELPVTVFSSNILIAGYGRIGKYLAKILQGLGARVTVSARRAEHFAWIQANGFTPVHTSSIPDTAGMYDVIINTIPHPVIDSAVLSKVKPDVFVLDLASAPGGVDFEYAHNHSVKVVSALSLPGKVAPVSAGKIVCDSVLYAADELGFCPEGDRKD